MNRRLTLDRFLKDIANARYHTCLLKDELADARPHRLFPCSNPAEQVMPIGDKTAVLWLEMIGSRPWYIMVTTSPAPRLAVVKSVPSNAMQNATSLIVV